MCTYMYVCLLILLLPVSAVFRRPGCGPPKAVLFG